MSRSADMKDPLIAPARDWSGSVRQAIRFATNEPEPRVTWRQWSHVPRKGDHVRLDHEGIFGTVVSVLWTDSHVAVVLRV